MDLLIVDDFQKPDQRFFDILNFNVTKLEKDEGRIHSPKYLLDFTVKLIDDKNDPNSSFRIMPVNILCDNYAAAHSQNLIIVGG